MTDIQVHKNGPQQTSTLAKPQMTGWDPSRWISRMMSFDPFREMMPLTLDERDMSFAPAFEVKDTNEGYLFKADLPGVKLTDIDVSVTTNRLQISGKREAEKEDKGDTFYTYERTYGSFSRAFTLPEGVDAAKVRADLSNGVLTVLVPKTPASMPHKVAIGTPASDAKKA